MKVNPRLGGQPPSGQLAVRLVVHAQRGMRKPVSKRRRGAMPQARLGHRLANAKRGQIGARQAGRVVMHGRRRGRHGEGWPRRMQRDRAGGNLRPKLAFLGAQVALATVHGATSGAGGDKLPVRVFGAHLARKGPGIALLSG